MIENSIHVIGLVFSNDLFEPECPQCYFSVYKNNHFIGLRRNIDKNKSNFFYIPVQIRAASGISAHG